MAEQKSEDIALRRINEAARNGAIELDLSGLYLTTLPIEIGQLRSLERLDLSYRDQGGLDHRIGDYRKRNRLKNIPREIRFLTNLKHLNLSANELSELPSEIKELQNLQTLDLRGNKITKLPTEIGAMGKLEKLLLGSCITTLGYVDTSWTRGHEYEEYEDTISSNELGELPDDIGKLTNLKELDLSNNKLKSLPESINKIKGLQVLDLRGNGLNIPPEILEKTEKPQTILNYYFSLFPNSVQSPTLDPKENVVVGKLLQTKYLNEIKLLFVGQGSVGKTSLIKRILSDTFNQNEIKTEGITINRWEVVNKSPTPIPKSIIKVNIWDFGGQEIMHATHQFFLTKRSLYLLVLDSRLTQEENRVEYWLKIIQSFGGESPVLIVGNKIDQHPLDIDRTGLQKKYPNIVGILETSAATGAGIEELKAAITEQVNNLPHVRDLLPETWFTVKTKLEALGKQSNFITQEKYLDLCADNEVSDETSQRTLIGFLHDLGVVLHFQDDPRLEALGILNPQWVTNGVYKILNSHALFQNKGVLTTSMLDEILNLPEYPRGKRLFIVDMMKKFELCYDIEPDKTFLVPDLLPKDQPDLKFNGIPAFEYAYPVLPSSVITRFIVRMNQKIDDGFVWRTGVVLKIGENTALVKADIEDRKITIAIDGLEHKRREAIFAIRYELGEIHNSIKGLNPQQRVPIPDAPNAEPLDYDYLLQLERDGFEELPVKAGNRLVKVNVRKLLSGVVSETERKQSAGNTTNIYIGGDVSGGTITMGNDNDVNK